MITAQWGKGNGGLYRYCRCTRKNGACSERYLQEQSLATQALTILKPLAISGEQASEIRAAIDRKAAEENQSLETSVKALEAKLSPLQDKLNPLTHGYLDQLIDEETYRQAKEEIVVQKSALKREKERLQRSRTSCWIEPAQKVVTTLETLGKMEISPSLPEISHLVQKIGSNHEISRKTVSFLSLNLTISSRLYWLLCRFNTQRPTRREATQNRNVNNGARERT